MPLAAGMSLSATYHFHLYVWSGTGLYPQLSLSALAKAIDVPTLDFTQHNIIYIFYLIDIYSFYNRLLPERKKWSRTNFGQIATQC